MNVMLSRNARRHADRGVARGTLAQRPAWFAALHKALFYFGVTLLPLLVAIVAYQLGLV